MNRDTGGPAFPAQDFGEEGMTLRDYFAGQALAGMAMRDYRSDPVIWAADAYRAADAMLKARED